MGATPSSSAQGDPSIQLPPGALPPPMEPRLTWRQWWKNGNGMLILSIIAAVGFVVGLWAAENVPVLPGTQNFHTKAVPFQIEYTEMYQWSGSIPADHGGSVTATYWSPPGAVVNFQAGFGTETYLSNSSSGSFHLQAGNSPDFLTIFLTSDSPATVYINGTFSYVAPLI